MTRRILLFAATTGYQTRTFEEAAARLGIEIVYATDRCDQLDDPWHDDAIAVRFHEEGASEEGVLAALGGRHIDGVLAVGDRPAVLAARVARALGLPAHPPEAARAASDKQLARARFVAAGLPSPLVLAVTATADPKEIARQLRFPVVVKPTVLSGSRGVIRADDPQSFAAAFTRVQRLLKSADIREQRADGGGIIHIEEYLPGDECAVEGLLDHGALGVLAVFDKPDPLEGPFFEESIYVTPSRAGAERQGAILEAVERACAALGLCHGPIHAECRVNDRGVYVLEVAARPIGGLCARALRFENGRGDACGLEERLLLHAIGDTETTWRLSRSGSAVMMIPIPRGGVYRRVSGIDQALAVAGVSDVVITAKPDQRLVPLPEGASYLGFIFASGAGPADAERAVREAHARLRFEIDPAIDVLPANF